MILVAILALSMVVIAVLFSILQTLGSTDAGALVYILQYMPYVVRGVEFINGFIYADLVMPLLASIFVAHGVFVTYRLYMWIVKKMPMLGVSD